MGSLRVIDWAVIVLVTIAALLHLWYEVRIYKARLMSIVDDGAWVACWHERIGQDENDGRA